MHELINELDPFLEYESHPLIDHHFIIIVSSTRIEASYP